MRKCEVNASKNIVDAGLPSTGIAVTLYTILKLNKECITSILKYLKSFYQRKCCCYHISTAGVETKSNQLWTRNGTI